MKFFQLIILIASFIFAIRSFGAAVDKRENFFVKVLSEPNEIDAPATLSKWTFKDPVFDWLLEQSGNIHFGRVVPKAIPATYSDEKKDIIRNNIAQMVALVEKPLRETSLRNLLILVDNKIEAMDFNDALSAAKAFRHLQNTVANRNHPLGDFVCFYILTSKILVSKTNDVLIPKMWLSDAYYEISQVYSHLIDYKNKNWKKDGKLYLFSELTDNGKRVYSDASLTETLPGVSYLNMVNTKLELLKYSLLNNLNNHSAWVRAIEFSLVDLPFAEREDYLTRFMLPMSFEIKGKIEELVAMKFEEITRNSDHTFLPAKFQTIKSKFLPVVLKVLSDKIAAVKNKQAERSQGKGGNGQAKRQKTLLESDKENQQPALNASKTPVSTTN